MCLLTLISNNITFTLVVGSYSQYHDSCECDKIDETSQPRPCASGKCITEKHGKYFLRKFIYWILNIFIIELLGNNSIWCLYRIISYWFGKGGYMRTYCLDIVFQSDFGYLEEVVSSFSWIQADSTKSCKVINSKKNQYLVNESLTVCVCNQQPNNSAKQQQKRSMILQQKTTVILIALVFIIYS